MSHWKLTDFFLCPFFSDAYLSNAYLFVLGSWLPSLFTLCVSVSEPLAPLEEFTAHLPGTAHRWLYCSTLFSLLYSDPLHTSECPVYYKIERGRNDLEHLACRLPLVHLFMHSLLIYLHTLCPVMVVILSDSFIFIYILTNACVKASGQCWIPSLITLHHVVLSQGLSRSLLSLPPLCWDLQLCQCLSVTWILGGQTQVLMLLWSTLRPGSSPDTSLTLKASVAHVRGHLQNNR